jgi:hypothetical protein
MVWKKKCRAVVKSVANLRVPYNAGKFLSTRITNQLLKMTPHLGFNWLLSYSNCQKRWLVFRLRLGRGTPQKTTLRSKHAHPRRYYVPDMHTPENTTFQTWTPQKTLRSKQAHTRGQNYDSKTAHPTTQHSDSKRAHSPEDNITIPKCETQI